MVGEASAGKGRLFLDTSLIVAATVEVHPSHQVAVDYVDAAVAAGEEMCMNLQVCREFLAVLTRQPVSGRTIDQAEALGALEVWTTGCQVLEETQAVSDELVALVRQYEVRGKQVHDCNIVATMLAHGVTRLATRNAKDFTRYGNLIQVDAVG